jgi:hypothetical protein
MKTVLRLKRIVSRVNKVPPMKPLTMTRVTIYHWEGKRRGRFFGGAGDFMLLDDT